MPRTSSTEASQSAGARAIAVTLQTLSGVHTAIHELFASLLIVAFIAFAAADADPVRLDEEGEDVRASPEEIAVQSTVPRTVRRGVVHRTLPAHQSWTVLAPRK